MKKGTKIFLGIAIIAIILVIAWLIYDNSKANKTNVNGENNIPNEGVEVSNSADNIVQNEEINNEISENETNNIKEETNDEKDAEEQEKPEKENSEVVSGTNASREEKALQLAKEYYKENYGNVEEVYFNNQGVNGAGNYIVRAGVAGVGSYRYFIVNLDTDEVTEK